MTSAYAWNLCAAPDSLDDDPQSRVARSLRASESQRANSDDQALVARIRAGDATAFEVVVHRYYADLCGYVASFIHRDDAAEELVQDLLFRVWTLGARWNVQSGIATYLYGAARHAAIRYAGRERRGAQWVAAGEASDVHGHPPVAPDASVTNSALNHAIAHAILSLPPRSREAFILTRRVGMTYADAAHVMGVSVKTVETQVRLALQTLRAKLAPWKL